MPGGAAARGGERAHRGGGGLGGGGAGAARQPTPRPLGTRAFHLHTRSPTRTSSRAYQSLPYHSIPLAPLVRRCSRSWAPSWRTRTGRSRGASCRRCCARPGRPPPPPAPRRTTTTMTRKKSPRERQSPPLRSRKRHPQLHPQPPAAPRRRTAMMTKSPRALCRSPMFTSRPRSISRKTRQPTAPSSSKRSWSRRCSRDVARSTTFAPAEPARKDTPGRRRRAAIVSVRFRSDFPRR